MTEHLVNRISSSIGFNFSNEKSESLHEKITNVLEDLNLGSAAELEKKLSKSIIEQEIVRSIAKHFTVGETYFYRDPQLMSALKNELENLVVRKHSGNRTIKIWSAGCSSGEEIYTVLFMLKEILGSWDNWKLMLFGTDINPIVLNKAKEGIYSNWSFRGNTELQKSNYFDSIDKSHSQVKKEYRDKVSFRFHNLVDNIYPSPTENIFDLDVILCRNVLMYFSNEVRNSVIKKLYDSLIEEGILCLSPSENMIAEKTEFKRIVRNGATLYRKTEQQQEEINKLQAKKFDQLIVKRKLDRPVQDTKIKKRTNSLSNRRTVKKVEAKNDKSFNEQIKTLYLNNKYTEIEELMNKNKSEMSDPILVEYFIRAMANRREFHNALQSLTEILKKEKLNADLHFLLGNLLFEMGDVNDAIKAYHSALYLNEEHIQSMIALGNIYMNKLEINKANNYLEHAAELLREVEKNELIDKIDEITASDYLRIVESSLKIKEMSQ